MISDEVAQHYSGCMYKGDWGGMGRQCNQYQYNDEQWSEIKQTQRATKTRGASRCMYGRRENTKWE